MAQHLISGSQFLGYTLHQAQKGMPTQLLAGFDARSTAADATAALAGIEPAALLEELEGSSGAVVDLATGRSSDVELMGSDRARVFLGRLAAVMT